MIARWEAKLPLSKTTLETTWLCHEIGRCYLELRLYTKAREYGQRSLEAAQQAGELSWQLHGRVLIAQAEGRAVCMLIIPAFCKFAY